MNIDTGEIRERKDLLEAFRKGTENPDDWREMKQPPTRKQMKRNPPKIGRNERCPCGSGRKFKRCCMRRNNDA